MQDIHNIRPPVQVGFDPMMLKIALMVLGAILILALVFFLVRKWLKNRKHSKDLLALPMPLAPYEAALKELAVLSQKEMGDPRLFYFDLTAVLRKYIGGSFHINAIEMTSQEFIRGVNQLDLANTVKKDIVKFQNLSDPFKYAGITAQKEEVTKDLIFIKAVIETIENNLELQKKTAQERDP